MRFIKLFSTGIVIVAIALLAAAGCSSSTAVPPGGSLSNTNLTLATGTTSLPSVDGFSETITIASAEPSGGVRAKVATSVTLPETVPSSSALCSPAAIINPLLYVTFNVAARLTIVSSTLTVTLPPNVTTTGRTFWALFVDASHLPSGCDSYPGSPNADTAPDAFAFDINDSGSTTLVPGDTYVLVMSSSPFFCCPTSSPSAAADNRI